MINKTTLVHGKRWGRRLGDKLKSPPLGISAWIKRHTTVIKDEPKKVVAFFEIRKKPCFLKLYRRRSIFFKLLYFARLGRPMNSYKTGLHLAAEGVPVPRPLCCVVVSEGLLVLSEAFVSDGDYCQIWNGSPGREQVRKMMRGAGETIAAAHSAGYTHGDCKWNNLLWYQETCFLVDFDGARKIRFSAEARMARDIARFTVSAEEAGVPGDMLEEFLDSYLRDSDLNRDRLIELMQPQLEKLRGRHFEQYGISPQPLL